MKHFTCAKLDIWLKEIKLDNYAVRGALIKAKGKVVVWDTLSHPRDMADFFPLLTDREIIVIYSHADYDHIWGTAGLPIGPWQVIGHSSSLQRFNSDVRVTLAKRLASEGGQWQDVRLVPPNQTFDSSLILDLGDTVMELHSLPGHTDDSIVAFFPREGLLLAGDAVETPLPEVSNPDNVVSWIEYLRSWRNNSRVELVIPAHGPTGGPELLQQTIDYLDSLLVGDDLFAGVKLPDFYHHTHLNNLQRMILK